MEYVGEHLGCKIYFSGISYKCPKLALWGYSSERVLKAAISRKLKKSKR